MSETRAILFDLDGTLIDTTRLILSCFDHAWLKVHGLTPSRKSLLETFGIPLREAMRRLLILTATEEACGDKTGHLDVIERLLVEYRLFNVANHDELAQPFEGVVQVVTELRSRGYAIGVVTSKGRELATRGLRLCALEALMDVCVFLEDTDRHKPDPDPIRTGLERLSAEPIRAAYVGDSRFDIIAGKAAGVRTVAALWGPAPRAELEIERPDHFADDITGLLEIFQ
jgi:pyrophosphatase PpaX